MLASRLSEDCDISVLVVEAGIKLVNVSVVVEPSSILSATKVS